MDAPCSGADSAGQVPLVLVGGACEDAEVAVFGGLRRGPGHGTLQEGGVCFHVDCCLEGPGRVRKGVLSLSGVENQVREQVGTKPGQKCGTKSPCARKQVSRDANQRRRGVLPVSGHPLICAGFHRKSNERLAVWSLISILISKGSPSPE